MGRKKKAAPVEVPIEVPVEAAEERRAPDADGAVEVAFVEGVLPDADRRTSTVARDSATLAELYAKCGSRATPEPVVEPVVGIDPIPSEPPLRSRADDLLFLSQRKPGA